MWSLKTNLQQTMFCSHKQCIRCQGYIENIRLVKQDFKNRHLFSCVHIPVLYSDINIDVLHAMNEPYLFLGSSFRVMESWFYGFYLTDVYKQNITSHNGLPGTV